MCVCVARYGFRGQPDIMLSAQPRLGTRDVTLTQVTDWIENKLVGEMHVSGYPVSTLGVARNLWQTGFTVDGRKMSYVVDAPLNPNKQRGSVYS